MENEKRGTKSFLKVLFISISLLSVLFFAFNYYLKKNLNNLLKQFSPYHANVDEVKNIIFPFFLKAKGVKFEIDKGIFDIEELSLRFYPIRYMLGKSYLDLEITNLKGDIPQHFWEVPTEHPDISKFKTLKISSLDIRTDYNEINLTLKTNSIYYKYGGEFSIPYISGDISKDNISEKFIGRVKLIYNPKILKIDYLDLKGDNFFLQFTKSEKVLNSSQLRSNVEGFLDDKFIKMLDKNLTGRINFKGIITDTDIESSIHANLTHKDKKLELNLSLNGNIKDKLTWHSKGVTFDEQRIYTEGVFFTKEKKSDIYLKFTDGYKIYSDKKWDVVIKDLSLKNFDGKVGTLRVDIVSNEPYNISTDIKKINDRYLLENLVVKSKTFSGKGKGSTNLTSLNIDISGIINNNPNIKQAIKNDFTGEIKASLYLSKDDIVLKGDYSSHNSQTLYGIKAISTKGSFNLNLDNITFTNYSTLENGKIDIDGFIDFNTKKEKFTLQTEKVPFYEILNFFDAKSEISYLITGRSNIYYEKGDYFGDAEFKVEDFKITPNKVVISFKNTLLKVENILLEKNIIKPELTFDFKKDQIKGEIKLSSFKLANYPEIKDLSLKIDGSIEEPKYSGICSLDVKYLENKIFKFNGDLKKINFNHSSNSLKIMGDLNFEKMSLTNSISLSKHSIDNLSITGDLNIYSKDLKQFSLASTTPIEIEKNGNRYTLEDITLSFDQKNIKNGRIIVSSKLIKNIKVNIHESTFNNIKGNIEINNPSLSIDYIKFKDLTGSLAFEYDFHSYPKINGKINAIADLNYPELRLKLRNITLHSHFTKESFTSTISSREINGMIYSSRYYDNASYHGNISFKDIFIEKRGFYGLFSGKLEYNASERIVFGDIFIDKGVFRYAKYEQSLSTQQQRTPPFKLDLKITNKSPIKITDGMLNGNADLKLHLKYDEKMSLTGELNLSNSYFTIQNNRFTITKGVMKILNNDTIFINMEANGTGPLSSTKIYVVGYLPDYRITIYDTKYKTDPYFNAGRNTGSQTLMAKIINDAVFKEIITGTNRIFGINRISVEPSSTGGVFKVGRTFSDRVEVNYTTNLDENKDSKLSAEYILFDWFKLNIFSTSKGGTGASIIFNFDF